MSTESVGTSDDIGKTTSAKEKGAVPESTKQNLGDIELVLSFKFSVIQETFFFLITTWAAMFYAILRFIPDLIIFLITRDPKKSIIGTNCPILASDKKEN